MATKSTKKTNPFGGSQKAGRTPQVTVNEFSFGLMTFLEPQQIPRGAAASSLNWITTGSKIEIRNGYLLYGTRQTGVGHVQQLFTAHRWDGTEILFRARGTHLEYYNTTLSTPDWTEIGSNLLVDEDVAMAEYFSPAGAQLWVSSPNSDLYKIMTANPGNYKSQYNSDRNNKGFIKISQNRMFLWNYLTSKLTLLLSFVDQQTVNTNYFQISQESIATGDGSTKSFTATLASVFGPRTCFGLKVFIPFASAINITAIVQYLTFAQLKVTASSHGLSVGNSVLFAGLKSSNTGTGTVSTTAGGSAVTGSGTAFTSQLAVGGLITIGGQIQQIQVINSDTSLDVGVYGQPNAVWGSTNTGVSFTYGTASALNNNVYTVTTVIDGNNFTITPAIALFAPNGSGYVLQTGSTYQPGSGGTISHTEILTDDYLGNLKDAVGSSGGSTGTINYSTGAITLTCAAAPGNSLPILVTYFYEDSTESGIADFTFSSTRVAGQGATLPQTEGGPIMYPHTYNGIEYVLHQKNSWQLDLSQDNSGISNSISNLVYRSNISSNYWRASVATADGIYYIDTTNQSWPYFALIAYKAIGVTLQVLPQNLSGERLDLTGYVFDQCVMWEWNQYIITAMRTPESTVNNVMLVYNKELGVFDLVDFYAASLAIYGGTLMAGDSTTGNVFQLFSGFDDDQATPYTYWIGNIENYGLQQLKKTKQLWLEGEIDPNQTLKVSVSIDRGPFVLMGTILGNGSYVDAGNPVEVGQKIVGQFPVGAALNVLTSNHYETNVKLVIDKFQNIQIKFETTAIGYVSVSMFTYFDIRTKQEKLPAKYRSVFP